MKMSLDTRLTLDFETPIKNKGHPFTPGNKAVSYSYKKGNAEPVFRKNTHPAFLTELKKVLSTTSLIIGFNFKFDLQHLWNLGASLPDKVRIWDCQIAEFILTGQTTPFESLDSCLEKYGLPLKQDRVKEYWEAGVDTADIPEDILEEYNNLDVDLTYELYKLQWELCSEKQRKLIILDCLDTITLATAERSGYLFDTTTCVENCVVYEKQLAEIEAELSNYLPKEIPPECTFNWASGDHLSALIYGGSIIFEWRTEEPATYKSGPNKGQEYLKGKWHEAVVEFTPRFIPVKNTMVKKCKDVLYEGTLFYQVDDPTLKQLKTRRKDDKRLLELLDMSAKKGKVLEMFKQFLNLFNKYGWENNLVHGQYNQTIARTGRLSSKEPNMQNTPPEIDELLVSRYAD
jgi:hypothetical protein